MSRGPEDRARAANIAAARALGLHKPAEQPEPQARALLEEYARREAERHSAAHVVDGIRKELFDRQIAFVDDPAREKAALCTRRAGKTSMWSRYCTIVALQNSRSIVRIWGISRLRAKQLLWEEFKLVAARHKVPLAKEPNETELTIKFANGSEIRLVGADKDKEAEKKRGDKTIMEVVLEAQLFGPFLQKIVEDIAGPCLFDQQGTFCLEGTPGPLCVGYWWEVSGRDDFAARWTSKGGTDGIGAGWSCHRWSVLDNPFLPHARAELTALKAKRRWADDNPTYVREWLGRWVNDLGALYYRFDPVRNVYDPREIQPWGPGWEHTLGWDLGSRDDMAIVVWGWHPSRPNLYEAFSWKEPGALSPRIMDVIRGLEARGFNFVKKVADTGGGGKMFVEEVISRYGVHFEAAKKTNKYDHVRLLNEDLLTGHVLLAAGSVYAQEIAALPRDPDWPDPEKPEAPPQEDPRFPNHCCDGGLYAYRGAWHYLHADEQASPVPGTREWFAAEEQRMVEQAARAAERDRGLDVFEDAIVYDEALL